MTPVLDIDPGLQGSTNCIYKERMQRHAYTHYLSQNLDTQLCFTKPTLIMKSFTIFSAIGFAAIVAAYAVPEASGQLEKRDVQSVDLLFLAGPASYNLTIPADGQEYFTGKFPSNPVFYPTFRILHMSDGIRYAPGALELRVCSKLSQQPRKIND